MDWGAASASEVPVSLVPPVIAVASPLLLSGSLSPASSAIVAAVTGNVSIDISPSRGDTPSGRSTIPEIRVVSITWSFLLGTRGGASLPLPRGPALVRAVVAVPPSSVDAISAAVPVAAVEAGRGAISVRSDADSPALGRRRKRCLAVVELSAVELVALLVRGDLMGLHGERGHLEIGMVHGIDCVDACSPVQFQQVLEQRDGSRAESATICLASLCRRSAQCPNVLPKSVL